MSKFKFPYPDLKLTDDQEADVVRLMMWGPMWATVEEWEKEEFQTGLPVGIAPDFDAMESGLKRMQIMALNVIERLDGLGRYSEKDEQDMQLFVQKLFARKAWIVKYRRRHNTSMT